MLTTIERDGERQEIPAFRVAVDDDAIRLRLPAWVDVRPGDEIFFGGGDGATVVEHGPVSAVAAAEDHLGWRGVTVPVPLRVRPLRSHRR